MLRSPGQTSRTRPPVRMPAHPRQGMCTPAIEVSCGLPWHYYDCGSAHEAPHFAVTLKGLVRAVAQWARSSLLATAKINRSAFLGCELYWCELGGSVVAVAEWLRLTQATAAPVVILSGFNGNSERALGHDFALRHNVFPLGEGVWRSGPALQPGPMSSPIRRDLMKPRQQQNDDADCSQITNEDPPCQQVPGALAPVLRRDIGKRAGYAS